jgi:hypothetical protein
MLPKVTFSSRAPSAAATCSRSFLLKSLAVQSRKSSAKDFRCAEDFFLPQNAACLDDGKRNDSIQQRLFIVSHCQQAERKLEILPPGTLIHKSSVGSAGRGGDSARAGE